MLRTVRSLPSLRLLYQQEAKTLINNTPKPVFNSTYSHVSGDLFHPTTSTSTTFTRSVHQTAKKETVLLDSSSNKTKFTSMNLQGLKAECKKRGLKVSGRKIDLIQRLVLEDNAQSMENARSFSNIVSSSSNVASSSHLSAKDFIKPPSILNQNNDIKLNFQANTSNSKMMNQKKDIEVKRQQDARLQQKKNLELKMKEELQLQKEKELVKQMKLKSQEREIAIKKQQELKLKLQKELEFKKQQRELKLKKQQELKLQQEKELELKKQQELKLQQQKELELKKEQEQLQLQQQQKDKLQNLTKNIFLAKQKQETVSSILNKAHSESQTKTKLEIMETARLNLKAHARQAKEESKEQNKEQSKQKDTNPDNKLTSRDVKFLTVFGLSTVGWWSLAE